jgi:hypothetical protein
MIRCTINSWQLSTGVPLEVPIHKKENVEVLAAAASGPIEKARKELAAIDLVEQQGRVTPTPGAKAANTPTTDRAEFITALPPIVPYQGAGIAQCDDRLWSAPTLRRYAA